MYPPLRNMYRILIGLDLLAKNQIPSIVNHFLHQGCPFIWYPFISKSTKYIESTHWYNRPRQAEVARFGSCYNTMSTLIWLFL